MKSIPFLDLKSQHAPLREKILESFKKVFDAAAFINGPDVRAFENALAQWLGVEDAVSVSCATDGLYASLRMLGIGQGDEVITTVHTAIATAEAITMTGAEVVFADIRPDTCDIDVAEAEKHISGRTKAIIAVHLYGQPAELDSLLALARKNSLFLIEDCAQALGAKYRGRSAGTIGDVGIYSFFPSKPLGGIGDGGAVVSKDPGLLQKIRMFCDHGRQSKFLHEFEGCNSRLDTIKAAMLNVALPHVDGWNQKRREIAGLYQKHLDGIAEIELPVVIDGASPVWHVYAIRVPNRETFEQYLKKHGVSTGIHYPYALNLLPAYERLGRGPGSYPHAEYHCAHTVSLPMHPMMTEEDVIYVGKTIRNFFSKNDKMHHETI
jgi:dTDP-4-amino-4,6-dideoxygalactose transaminase